jgi:outer membrane protein assembly factor BamE
MRHLLISVLLLSLAAGCSSVKVGPHRIDVQQGNALDQENLARLKPGLSRSQVRFLLGTPLLVDPFRTDRWDYVYVYYKAGKLTEQKRITLFFDSDTLVRIEGDVPVAVQPVTPAQPAPNVDPLAAPSPKSATGDLKLQPETDVTKIRPDVIPDFSGTAPVALSDDALMLKSLNEWAEAWRRRDSNAHLAFYDARFVPQGGGSRADWEKRKRQVMSRAKNIELEIDSPSIERTGDGAASVTFNQVYRSDSYRDAVVKQLRMIERDGRWLIVEEKVLSTLGARP